MDHRKYIFQEVIAGIVINGIITFGFAYALFAGMGDIQVWGRSGLALDLLPTTFMIALMTSIGLTIITRGRVRKGKVAASASATHWLPRRLPMRALSIALVTTLIFVPLGLAVLVAGDGGWTFGRAVIFKLILSTVISVLAVPLIVRAALGDGAIRPTPADQAAADLRAELPEASTQASDAERATLGRPTPLVVGRRQQGHLGVLRIVSGLLFLAHGIVKIFGFPTGVQPGPQQLTTLLGVGGVIELTAGTLIAVGWFSRPAAFLASGEMAIAYWMFHAPRGAHPLVNQGEPAILYCFLFLYLAVSGPGAFSLERGLRSLRT